MHCLHPLSALGLLTSHLIASAVAQTSTSNLTIYDDSDKYEYYGCYNETTQVEGSAQERALAGGINEVREGSMTVPDCLAFCGDGRTEYRYAGLEWSRECWCADALAGIAAELDNAECNFPCEGDNSTACGGQLRLSVYRLSSAAAGLLPSAVSMAAALLLASAIHGA